MDARPTGAAPVSIRRLIAALVLTAAGFAPAVAAPPSRTATPGESRTSSAERIEDAIRGRAGTRAEPPVRPSKPDPTYDPPRASRPAPPEPARPDVARRPGKPQPEFDGSAPAPSRSFSPRPDAARTEAPVVHLVAVAASNDRKIGPKVGDDARNIAALFEESFAAAGKHGQLRTRLILGGDTGSRSLLTAIRGLDVRPQDTVVVFFSGHGMMEGRGRHVLQLRPGDDLTTREVLDAMAAQNPRLSVLLTDVCSSYPGDREGHTEGSAGSPRDLPRGAVIPWATVEQLFLSHRGGVDVTAAEPGLPSRVEARGRGSYFTNALIQVLSAPHPAAVTGLDRNGDRALQWAEVLPQVRAVAAARDRADNRYRDRPVEPQQATARALGTWAPPAGVALAE
jgi:hypothetical protein